MVEKVFSGLYKLYFFLLFTCTLIAFYPVFYILLAPKNKRFLTAFKFKRFWAKILFYGSFNRIEVHGERAFKTPSIICPNHSSYLDIIVCYICFTEPFLFIGKAELLKWPLFNIFFKYMDIPIQRGSAMQAAKSMVKARQALAAGYSLIIFPEGTISSIAPKLKPFKNGAIKLAKDSQHDIIPITFVGNEQVLSVNSPLAKSGPKRVNTFVHDALKMKQNEMTTAELSTELRSKIESKLSWK